MTRTWQTGLTVWCGLVGLFGLVLVGSGWAATSGPATAVMEVMNGSKAWVFEPQLRFTLAVLGAVTLGWALTLLAVVRISPRLDRSQNRDLWRGVMASVMVWYVMDSGLSLVTGFWPDAVSNTLFLLTFWVLVHRSGVLCLRDQATGSGRANASGVVSGG